MRYDVGELGDPVGTGEAVGGSDLDLPVDDTLGAEVVQVSRIEVDHTSRPCLTHDLSTLHERKLEGDQEMPEGGGGFECFLDQVDCRHEQTS